MNTRACLLIALVAAPAWTQEPMADATIAPRFELKSDAIKKIVRDTAASQYGDVETSRHTNVKPAPSAFSYVPPEGPPAPARPPQPRLPAPSPESNGFVSQLFGILADELTGTHDDGVTAKNELLRCRVQKETKTAASGVDNCPRVD